MKLHSMLPFRTTICGLVLLAVAVKSDNLVQQYCSNENTGSGASPYYNNYQSLGSCSGHCQEGFAFGVVQGKNCWCSNYIPAKQSAVSDCNVECPGFGYEDCGNPYDGLYGYIALNKAPLGTAGAASSTKQQPLPDKTPTRPVSPTVTKTVTDEQTPRPSVVVSLVTPTPSSSPESTTTTSKVYTKVTRISGAIVTETVTSTPVGESPNTSSNPPLEEKMALSGGAIAGIVIGTLAGIALIALAAFFSWHRQRKNDTEGGSPGAPKRKGSVLSRTGLLGGARPQSMAEMPYDDSDPAEPVTARTSVRHSMMFGAGASGDGIAPASLLGSSHDAGSDRRQSKPLVYDQRLNPSALFAHDNGSQVSMQDQQDYSRPLGLANPDFARTYSYDSR